MATGQTIVNAALVTLGVLPPGATPGTDASNDALAELNTILDSYSADDTFVYGTQVVRGALTAATNPNPIGPSASSPFNVARPSRIETAVMFLAVSTGTVRKVLHIVDSARYFSHADLTTAATVADELYYDNGDSSGAANIYLFPVPACGVTTTLELEVWAQLTQMTLGGTITLQPAYSDMLEYRLAFRLAPRYAGFVRADVKEVLRLALEAEQRVRALNAANRLKQSNPPVPAMPPEIQPPATAMKG